jgi:uncharacterized protein with HEPN domain
MSPSVSDLLHHMLDEIDYLLTTHAEVSKVTFDRDQTLRRAFVRSIEILGEAAKKVPEDFRNACPNVPWKTIAGMRDRLIHGYFAVDYDIVWDVVENKLPNLRPFIAQMLDQLAESE